MVNPGFGNPNFIVPTPPPGDSSNRIATTKFGGTATVPTLSGPLVSAITATTCTITITTNLTGLLYWIVSTSATPPSLAQITAGHDSTGNPAAASGSQAVTVVGAQNTNVTGLTSGVTYYAYWVQSNITGQFSSVASSSSFQTLSLASIIGLIPANFNFVGPGNITGPFTVDGVNWATTRSSVSTATFADPIGGTTAQHLTEDSTASNTHFIANPTANSFDPGLTLNIPMRCQIIARQDQRTRIVAQVTAVSAFTVSVGFDLAGGNTGYDTSVSGGTLIGQSMTAIAGGYWLCSFDFMVTNAGYIALSQLNI